MEEAPDMIEQLKVQIEALDLEKEFLKSEIGTSEPEELLLLIKNMEEQLVDLYRQKEEYRVVQAKAIQILGPKTVYIKQG
ncbi:MAG: hypothetical protein H7A25_19395 [Leptospiraceae bacterium]|nr:hypothetical protein [Leptospiraceae bacterium]MCP5502073.1 hypothetical protein [Leptospiraceae bacterium]